MPQHVYDCILERSSCLRQVSRTFRAYRRASLYFCFQCWRRRYRRCFFSGVFGFASPNFLMQLHTASRRLDALSLQPNLLLQCWHAATLDTLTDGMLHDLSTGNIHALNTHMNCIKRRATSVPDIRIHDANGMPAHSLVHEKTLVREHFAEQLQGKLSSFEILVEHDRTLPAMLSRRQAESTLLFMFPYFCPPSLICGPFLHLRPQIRPMGSISCMDPF